MWSSDLQALKIKLTRMEDELMSSYAVSCAQLHQGRGYVERGTQVPIGMGIYIGI